MSVTLVAALSWLIIPHGDAVSLEAAKQAALQSEMVRPVAATVNTTFEVAGTLGHAGRLLLKALPAWTLAAVLGGAAFVWCTALGLGTAAWRLAAPQR